MNASIVSGAPTPGELCAAGGDPARGTARPQSDRTYTDDKVVDTRADDECARVKQQQQQKYRYHQAVGGKEREMQVNSSEIRSNIFSYLLKLNITYLS